MLTPAPTTPSSASLQDAHVWRLEAKVAVRSSIRNVSMKMRWEQTGDDYEIRFYNPMGLAVAQINGGPGSVTLDAGRGGSFSAASPELLLERELQLRIPVSPMRYWLRGVPDPAADFDWTDDDLHDLVQSGWHIRYTGTDPVGLAGNPERIRLSRDAISILVVAKDWQWL